MKILFLLFASVRRAYSAGKQVIRAFGLLAALLLGLFFVGDAQASQEPFVDRADGHVDTAGSLTAAKVDDDRDEVSLLAPTKIEATDTIKHPKLASILVEVSEAHDSDPANWRELASRGGLLVENDDEILLEVEVDGAAQTSVQDFLQQNGMRLRHDNAAGLIEMWLPISNLQQVISSDEVYFIRPARLVQALQGNSLTQGLALSEANSWHTAGFDGSGVTIAVIDRFNSNYTALQSSGDWPSDAQLTTIDQHGGGFGSHGDDHGLATVEVIYDMAPGATFRLYDVETVGDWYAALIDAADNGVDIVSVSLNAPLDGIGDGTARAGSIAEAANYARNAGVLVVNGAGNERQQHWGGLYQDHAIESGTHDWGSGQRVNQGSSCLSNGEIAAVDLFWDDWTDVDHDYDLQLVEFDGAEWITRASSSNVQNGGAGQTPQESIRYTLSGALGAGGCPAGQGQFGVVVINSNAATARNLQLFTNLGGLDEVVSERSLAFPADSPDVMSVAAVDIHTPHRQEADSSEGAVLGTGGSLGASTIQKPNIVGYANVNTEAYGVGGFAGTSAATAHVAGAAALALHAHPSYENQPAQLQSLLEHCAIDLGANGFDTQYGAGRLSLCASISGTVTDPDGTPLSDIQAVLYQPSTTGGWQLLDTTDSIAGRYAFAGLASGTYRVCFDDPSGTLAFQCYDDAPIVEGGTDIAVQNTPVVGIDVALSDGGGIRGKVTDWRNTPLENVDVLAFTPNHQLARQTTTDSDGNYYLFGLAPGGYVIEFVPDNTYPNLVRKYFLNTPDFHDAFPLPVSGGSTMGGINGSLGEKNGVISGTIAEPDTAQARSSEQNLSGTFDPFLHVYQKINDVWHYRTDVSVEITPIGANFFTYNVSGLNPSPANEYKLGTEDQNHHYVSEYYNDQYTFHSADTIRSDEGNIFIAVAENPGTIEGVITDERSGTIPVGVHVQALRFEDDTDSWERLGRLYNDEVQVDPLTGQYSIEGLPPGRYRVYFYHPGDPTTYPPHYYNNALADFRGSNFENAEDVIIPVSGGSSIPSQVSLIYRNNQAPPVAEIENRTGGTRRVDPHTGQITIQKVRFPNGGFSIETEIVCPDDLIPYDVTFVIDNPTVSRPTTLAPIYPLTYPMSEILPAGSGIYQADVPKADLDDIFRPASGNHAAITTRMRADWKCPGLQTEQPPAPPDPPTEHSKPIGKIVLHDPSGFITDADTGEPIVGAAVSLHKVDGWIAKDWPGDERDQTCQSHNSKEATDPWSQPAPIELGLFTNPDSLEISPNINPQLTDEIGHYGWDVAAGCWYVVVRAERYESKISSVVGVPPEVTDLHLALTPFPPEADFALSEESGMAPLTVVFTDTSLGTVTSWLWDFGDGNTSDEQWPTHTYSEPGTYSVSLTVANSSGDDVVTREQLITVSAPEADIDLLAGWNLVSIPVQPTEREVSEVLASIAGKYDVVYAYDGCDGGWKTYDPNGPPFANSLSEIDITMGLWINMTSPGTLAVEGIMPDQTTISSCSGWNLIGYPSLQELPAQDVLSWIRGKYTIVYAYEAENDSWKKYDPDGPPFANSLEKLQPGKGYWINTTEDVDLRIVNPVALP